MKCYLENITSCLGFGSAESQSLAQSFLRSCSFSLRSLCLDSITCAAPHGKARWERPCQPRGCPGDETLLSAANMGKKAESASFHTAWKSAGFPIYLEILLTTLSTNCLICSVWELVFLYVRAAPARAVPIK